MPSVCLNCGADVPLSFCGACGQKNVDYRVSLREVISDALDGLLQLDSRLARTLPAFVFRPGRLVREYNAGRRARYTSPLRLYLFFSIVYFFALGQIGNRVQVPSAVRDELAAARGGAGAGVEQIGVHLGWRPLDERINQRLKTQIKLLEAMSPTDAARRVLTGFAENAPRVLFFVLPLFALLLKILYLRSGRFYLEHLTLSLYCHAFAFLILLLCAILPVRLAEVLTGPILALAPIHLFLAMRGFYGQGWLKTAVKFALLCLLYAMVLLVGVVATAIVTLMLI